MPADVYFLTSSDQVVVTGFLGTTCPPAAGPVGDVTFLFFS